MNGLASHTVLHVLQSFVDAQNEGLEIGEVILSVNNNKAKKKFVQKVYLLLKEALLQSNLPSRGKDWNG